LVDGIVLHQILQWHHMLSSTNTDRIGVDYYPTNTVRGLEVNTLWDGLFHAGAWVATLIGLTICSRFITSGQGRIRAPGTSPFWSSVRCSS
jgi:uncharacterized membrane protein